MAKGLQNEIAEIDALIRAAQGLKAQEKLTALKAQGVPTELLADVARLCTRAGMPEASIDLLHPIVRPAAKLVRAATPRDYAEYGIALLRIGAVAEGRDLLKRISSSELPEVLLYQAISHLRSWEYSSASRLLRQYVESKSLTDYQKLIGRMNLAASLIMEESHDEIEALLSESLTECQRNKYELLYALCVRDTGTLYLLRNELERAAESFTRAEALLQSFGGHELHYARKWNALLKLKKAPGAEALAAVAEARAEAEKLKNWESVRNIDYHLALYTHDESLMLRLYFGTPYPEFKKRLVSQFKVSELPATYVWKKGEGPLLDLGQQKPLPSGDFLKVGMASHRLYECFISDFYRPFEVAALFERVFPGELYAPLSAGYRVHQSLKNLRKWFEDNGVPLGIVHQEGAYRIEAIRPCSILVREKTAISREAPRVGLMRERLKGEFTAKQVCEILNLELSSVQSLLKDAAANGVVERIGAGKNTRYRFLGTTGGKKAA